MIRMLQNIYIRIYSNVMFVIYIYLTLVLMFMIVFVLIFPVYFLFYDLLYWWFLGLFYEIELSRNCLEFKGCIYCVNDYGKILLFGRRYNVFVGQGSKYWLDGTHIIRLQVSSETELENLVELILVRSDFLS
jgi:hypothetical protein